MCFCVGCLSFYVCVLVCYDCVLACGGVLIILRWCHSWSISVVLLVVFVCSLSFYVCVLYVVIVYWRVSLCVDEQ